MMFEPLKNWNFYLWYFNKQNLCLNTYFWIEHLKKCLFTKHATLKFSFSIYKLRKSCYRYLYYLVLPLSWCSNTPYGTRNGNFVLPMIINKCGETTLKHQIPKLYYLFIIKFKEYSYRQRKEHEKRKQETTMLYKITKHSRSIEKKKKKKLSFTLKV